MTTSMGPPPPKSPGTTTTSSESMGPPLPKNPSTTTSPSEIMGPPPPKNQNPPEPEPEPEEKEARISPPECTGNSTPTESSSSSSSSKAAAAASKGSSGDIAGKKQEQSSSNAAVPYTIPSWSGPPCHPYALEVLKDGSIIDQFNVNEKGAFMFGRVDICDFVLEHPTISRFHAVLQFKSNGTAYLYDLGSTHGTSVNKNQVKKRSYVELHVGDVIRFGHSTRLYILQGPTELMLPEANLETIRNAKIQREMQDMEESILRAKLEASLADGVSWGMREDAIEEIEDEVDEITWQTYKGQLTEKQEKTREKVIKRLEKIAHMKKEIDAIRAKDIAQGGLTQGQQTQIARNEQRISQIMEELENLEETLNESIRESVGARGGRSSRGKKKGAGEEEEEEYLSDDDEFYDRTKRPSKLKSGENQSIETADSLLDKRDSLLKEIEDKKKLLFDENDNKVDKYVVSEAGDALDAYMSTVSSQLALDKRENISKELSALQSELDRILYLLKIADPTGEASKKRESKAGELKVNVNKAPAPSTVKQFLSEPNHGHEAESSLSGSSERQPADDITPSSSKEPEEHNNLVIETDSRTPVYTVVKPQWLGAVEDKKNGEIIKETPVDLEENDQFVDYRNRSKILEKLHTAQVIEDQGIEKAAPGLIIRKRKQVEKSDFSEVNHHEQSTGAEMKAEDAVALLLRHSRGYQGSDDEMSEGVPTENQLGKDAEKSRRVLGPEKPSFLSSDYESWVPPEGQSGDGRTSLNDRYGY